MSENEVTAKVSQILEIIFRQRWFLIIPFCIAMLVGIFLAITLPKLYEASTLILIEAQRVPEEFVQSIVSTDIDSRINTISQQILSRSNLEKVIKQLGLFSGPQYEKMLEIDKVNILRRNIDIQVTRGGHGRSPDSFSITYKGKSPEDVKNVANTLASYFIYENLKVREEQASGTSDFLDGELASMRKKLEKVEEVMKNYRKKYMGELPEQLESNLRILDRLQEQLVDRQTRLSEAKYRLSLLSKQQQPATLPTAPDGTTLLDQLRSELKALNSKYTERHPDIIRLKKRIASLEEQLKAEPKTVTNRMPMSVADRQAILDAKQGINSLTQEIAEMQSQIKQYKRRVENTPKREQELMGLQRDYQNIQQSYSSLQTRKLEADIAVNMEKKQKGERFRVIDYASLPEKPSSPDMRKLLIMVIAAGFGLGGGIVFLLEFLDSSFRRSDDVETFLEISVLAEIPEILHPKDIFKKRINQIGTVLSLLISLGLFLSFAGVALLGTDKIKALIRSIV